MRFLSDVFKKSLKAKLTLWYFLLAAAPIIFLLFSIYRNSYVLMQRKEIDIAENELNILIETLDLKIDQIKNGIISLHLMSDVLNETNTVQDSGLAAYHAGVRTNQLLKSTSSYSASGVSLAFVNLSGKVFDNGTLVNVSLNSDSPFIQDMVEKGVGWTIISRSLFSEIKVPVITVGRPVYYKGSLIGILLADIKYQDLDILFKSKNAQNPNIYLYNEQGALIYSFGKNDDFDDLDSASILKGDFTAEETNRFLHVETSSGDNGFTAIALIPRNELFKDSFNLMRQSFTIVLLLLLGSALLAWFLGRLISKDIMCLSDAVEKFSNDGLPVKTNITASNEIGRLNSSIELMTRMIPELMREVKEKEVEKHYLQRKALIAQMNPHMMYNTLNTITFLAQSQGIDNIAEVSESFVKMLHMLSNIPGDFLTVKQEIDYLKSYINIKKYNLLTPIDVQFQIAKSVLPLSVPKLILQPFVENSLKHGFRNSLEMGRITVLIYKLNNELRINIKDNGCGIPAGKIEQILGQKSDEEHETVGIFNTYQRLKLFYGEDKCLVRFDSDGRTYTAVMINIPLS